MPKDTAELVKELGLCADFKKFYRKNQSNMITASLAETLAELLNRRGLTRIGVIKKSELSEVYGYQIFSGRRLPERGKLLCLALAMELNLEEVQQVLRAAGYSPLYVKIPFDAVVIYGFCHHKTVAQVNQLLYEYELDTLG